MARAALPGRLTWQLARVGEVVDETPRARSIRFAPEAWPGHRAGQHVDIRLTAEDGYQAQRSYSIASAPEDEGVVLTVERLDNGEVSPYLVDELRPGDEIEMRGPIGGYFVWGEASGGPLMLIAGGSGVVPLRSMLRHRVALDSDVPVRLVYSARSLEDVIYRSELETLSGRDGVDVHVALTRSWPDGWAGRRGRITPDFLAEATWTPAERPLAFVCGPSAFVEVIAESLVAGGHEPGRVRTERFGPTGG